jgi:hypothetical protein
MKEHAHNHGQDHSHQLTLPKTPWTDWLPLIVVLLFIAGSTAIVVNLVGWSLSNVLSVTMGFFFVYFALFKLINLPGFAMGYQEYDLIAQKSKAWAYAYPFIEVLLGALYLGLVNNAWLFIITIVLTAINCAGVAVKLAKKEVFQCACLGTVLKVPLTKVSLVEYAAMGVMAVVMLALWFNP